MFKQQIYLVLMICITSLTMVTCGIDDETSSSHRQTVAPTIAATTETEKQTFQGGPVPADELKPVDLSKEGDVVDLTVLLHDGANYIAGAPPYRYQPWDMTFKVGQTVNFTLEFANPESSQRHTFNVPGLGISERVKYGKSGSFTHTFDKAGTFKLFCASFNDMTGDITVQ